MTKDNQKSQIVIYKTEDGRTKIDVRFEHETVWLTQNALAELFQTTKNNISMHVKNIFSEGELERISTVKDFLTVQKEGNREVSRGVEYYNLDLIISVGYRVKSNIATAFRQWATAHLREFIVKEQELPVLNNLVEQYLVFAEGQAMQRIPMYMKDWIQRLDEFLKLNRKDILAGAGKISHELAKELAEKEYDIYYKTSLTEPSQAEKDFDVIADKAVKLVDKRKPKKQP